MFKWKYVSSGQRTLASVEGVCRVRERCGRRSTSNSDELEEIYLSLTSFGKPVLIIKNKLS
jgi:hypothetical protein